MELRRRTRPTSSWERARFVIMWTGGMSLRAIARHTGSSVTTVYRWIRRWQHEGHISTRNRIHSSSEYYNQYYVFKTEAAENKNDTTSPVHDQALTTAYSMAKLVQTLQNRDSLNKNELRMPGLTYEHSKCMSLNSKQEVDDKQAVPFLCHYGGHRQFSVL